MICGNARERKRKSDFLRVKATQNRRATKRDNKRATRFFCFVKRDYSLAGGNMAVNDDAEAPQVFAPPPALKSTAHIRSLDAYRELYSLSATRPDEFWRDEARNLHFAHWSDRGLESNIDVNVGRIAVRFMAGAKTNVAFNCLDRHVAQGGRAADERRRRRFFASTSGRRLRSRRQNRVPLDRQRARVPHEYYIRAATRASQNVRRRSACARRPPRPLRRDLCKRARAHFEAKKRRLHEPLRNKTRQKFGRVVRISKFSLSDADVY